MELDPELRAWIQRKITEFSSDSSEEPAYLKVLVGEHQILPILIDRTGFWGIRPYGEILLIATEEENAPPTVETDPRIRRTAIYQGAKKYPELAPLLPTRPATAQDCPHCAGTGRIDVPGVRDDSIICYCGGTSWLE